MYRRAHNDAGLDATRAPEDFVAWSLRAFDSCIRTCEPAFALLAAVLVCLDAYVFFTQVLPQVVEQQGTGAAVLHASWGLWLLFNVLFNQALCVFTRPGCTLDTNPEELHAAMTMEWRWCEKCNRGKPPLSHHCSICNKCVYKMDHHCPWMANCIGHANMRYFLLYLFYMWIGGIYSTCVSVQYIDNVWDIKGLGWPVLAFLTTILSIAVSVAMTLLFGVHVWMVLSGQGTLDMIGMYLTDKVDPTTRRATIRDNPYHLGAARNWQEAFHVSGPGWWFRWLLPRRIHRPGKPWEAPRRTPALALAGHATVAVV